MSSQYSSSSYVFGSDMLSYEWHINGVNLLIKDQTISIFINEYSKVICITIELTDTNSIGFYQTAIIDIASATEGQTSIRIEAGTSNSYRKSEAITLAAIGLDYCVMQGLVSFDWALTLTTLPAIDLS